MKICQRRNESNNSNNPNNSNNYQGKLNKSNNSNNNWCYVRDSLEESTSFLAASACRELLPDFRTANTSLYERVMFSSLHLSSAQRASPG